MRRIRLIFAVAAAVAVMMMAAAPAMADYRDDDWRWGPGWGPYWGAPVGEVDVDREGPGPYDRCYLEDVDWDNDGFWELDYVCY